MNYVALKMLLGDRAKYLSLIFTVAFASFLLANQVSIFCGILLRTASQIVDVPDADLWVMDRETQYFDESKALKDYDLYRIRGVPGVAWAVNLYKGFARATALDGKFRQVILLGVDDATLVGAPRNMLLGKFEDLKAPDAVIIDRAGYQYFFPGEPLSLGKTFEFNDHRARLVGIAEASAPFATFPIFFTRYSQALSYVGRERNLLAYVLVKSQPGTSLQDLGARIETATRLRAVSGDEFKWQTIGFYLANTGIPVNFGITIALAFLVGAVVAGQTFYLFTLENLKHYGALKAIGVSNARIIGMILFQALTIGVFGYAIGMGIAAGFFELTLQHLPTRGIVLMWQAVVATGGTVLIIIAAASLLSVRRVLVLEPAVVFRG
ncbi:MAG: ABC transporter permease [Gammaproteobacteria bacterium]